MNNRPTTPDSPADPFDPAVAFLTPMFLRVSGGDANQARIAAAGALNARAAHSKGDRLHIAQSIAVDIGVLTSIGFSMDDHLPFPLVLDLHGNAATLIRAGEQARRALRADPMANRPANDPEADRRQEVSDLLTVDRAEQRLKEYAAAHRARAQPMRDLAATQPGTPVCTTVQTETAQIGVPRTVTMPPETDRTEIAAPETLQPTPNHPITDQTAAAAAPSATIQTKREKRAANTPAPSPPEPRHPTDTRRQPPIVESAVQTDVNDQTSTPTLPPPTLPPPPLPPPTEQQRRAAWAAVMTKVARDNAANVAQLPPAERKVAGMRAAALGSVAHQLLSSEPMPASPFDFLHLGTPPPYPAPG